jgi:phosphate-selective porin OprO/OprP
MEISPLARTRTPGSGVGLPAPNGRNNANDEGDMGIMMFKSHWKVSGAVSLAALLAAGSAHAQSASTSAEQMDKLQAQIKALEHELQGLKTKVDKADRADAAAADKAYATATPLAKAPATPPSAVAKMSPGNRPSICTPDGLNCIAITSRLHFDTGGYSYHPNTPAAAGFNPATGAPIVAGGLPANLDNGANARRARIGVLGTFMGDWNYALIYDFGGASDGFPPVSGAPISGIENAYLSYTGFKPLAIEGGYMDLPYTLDEATSSNDIMFMERASPGVIATNIAAGDFRSGAGVRGNDDRFWGGAYITGPTSGTTHTFTPTANNAAAIQPVLGTPGFREQFGGFARATYQVVQEQNYSFHLGADAEFLIMPTGLQTLTLSDRPELRIDPTALQTTGALAAVSSAQVYSGEAAAGYGPLFAQGEFFWYNVDRNLGMPSVHFTGWYAEGSWTITGEGRKYNPAAGAYSGIVPDRPFSLAKGDPGAWEIAFRYSHVGLNDLFTPGIPAAATFGVDGGVQNIYTIGLNWYVNRNVRFMVNYLHGTVDKFSAAATAAVPGLNPAFPAGTDVGAKFDALAMRTQIAF